MRVLPPLPRFAVFRVFGAFGAFGALRVFRALRVFGVFAVLALASGCAFLEDRGRDALDIARFEVGYGLGLEADVRATDLLRLGGGAAWSKRAGLRDGAFGNGEELSIGLPFAPFAFAAQKANGSALLAPATQISVGLGLADWTAPRPVGRSQAEAELFSPLLLGESAPERSLTRALDVEVGVTAGIVSVRVGLSPGELLDFLAGWIGFDPAGDDEARHRGSTSDAPEAPREQPDAHPSQEPSERPGERTREGPGAPPSKPPAPPARLREHPREPPAPPLEWLAADAHLHSLPADSPSHVRLDLAENLALAEARGVEAVVLSPHIWGPRRDAARGGTTEPWTLGAWRRRRGQEPPPAGATATATAPAPAGPAAPAAPPPVGEIWSLFADDARALARAPGAPIVVPGWEESSRWGHLIGFGDDLAHALAGGGAPSEVVHERGALVLAHPYNRRFHIPFAGSIAITDYVPWGEEADGEAAALARDGDHPLARSYTAAEAFNMVVDLAECANLVPREDRSVEKVLRRVERDILRLRRRIAVVGGSDNHRDWIAPACWVGVRARTAEGFVEGVRAGRVVLGRPHARSFEARSDREPRWQPIGAALVADRAVELRWHGDAELWIDGALAGVFAGGHRHAIEPASFHVYRIVQRESRSAWIYANLPEAR